MANPSLLILAGDGIGPEVMAEVVKVVGWFDANGMAFEVERDLVGGCAFDAHGQAISDATMDRAMAADAVLLGAVGGPKWDRVPYEVRPEAGLLRLRKDLELFANLRPAKCFDALADFSSLKRELVEGLDILIVRELTGGLYFGAKGEREDGTWFDTCEYTRPEVERIARRAFELARAAGRRLTSVDKVNVLHTSRLWRDVVVELGATEFPDVPLDHALVDSFAMTIVQAPETIEVVVTENTFGDILSDVAAAVTGGLGLAASASLGDAGPGLFEPVHGSAPQLAGRGAANPAAMLRSTALLLRHGLGLVAEADALELAVDAALAAGPTPDLGGTATTRELGDAVLRGLERSPTL